MYADRRRASVAWFTKMQLVKMGNGQFISAPFFRYEISANVIEGGPKVCISLETCHRQKIYLEIFLAAPFSINATIR